MNEQEERLVEYAAEYHAAQWPQDLHYEAPDEVAVQVMVLRLDQYADAHVNGHGGWCPYGAEECAELAVAAEYVETH